MKTFPIAGLRAFEAAARRRNFRQAGAELGMTATAVSQHVRALEDWLGTALFLRGARGVTLTEAGAEFGTAVTSGLGTIGQAAHRLRSQARQQSVRLACLPSIVSHWLAPRLSRFRAAHPEISVSISYAAAARTPAEAGADLLIQHGSWPISGAHPIVHAATRPTCAPAYLAHQGAHVSQAALRHADLLHDETTAAWQRWFVEGGLKADVLAGPVFADFNLLLSSLTAGLGIALCPTALIERELADGSLVVLSDRASDRDKVYWLMETEAPNDATRRMRDWLLDQASDPVITS